VDTLLQRFTQSSPLAGSNASYIEELYEQYLVAPDSVDGVWKTWFDGLKDAQTTDIPHSAIIAHIAQAARLSHAAHTGAAIQTQTPLAAPAKSTVGAGDERERNVGRLITAYRSRGHLGAKLDPLGLLVPINPPDLSLEFHYLTPADLDDEFSTGGIAGQPRMKLRDLLARLQATYTGSIGAEFMHITEVEQRQWLYQRLENVGGQYNLDESTRRRALERLTAAEGLEKYLHTKYVGQKRFSLEGGDSLIPLIDTVIHRSSASGVKDLIIGMAHRGRLNVLINILGKNPRKLFDEFEGKFEHAGLAVAGDVKYHMGFSADIATAQGPMHLALAFNPSHLEIVDPVVVGSVRSRQERRDDQTRTQVLPLLIHGDAAFAGQGVVMELFQMSQSRGFRVGGTVHVVINNQVGFTTSHRADARSTLYCTDIAKMVGAPVLHVNGDDPEAVVFAAQLACDFRQQFHKDVVIDLFCYRRWGHNEADEPAITQPLMYQVIRKHKTTRQLYAQKLEAEGVIPDGGGKVLVDVYRNKLESGEVTTELAQKQVLSPEDRLYVGWEKLLEGRLSDPVSTRVGMQRLTELAYKINTLPDHVQAHSRVAKVYADRLRMAAGQIPCDWGFAENLAYATIIDDGCGLRLVGQDVGRGTFTHRHAIVHDQRTDEYHLPLRQLARFPEQATIIDSLLSEEAVMAYEYGFSATDPNTLCIWEGQFGDFANGAQVVIDQFIASGESKWGRISGLTLLLPHGYEGQGPEHSSARLERFLQLCALDNMLVCVPSTPAQAFHMLRRQMCMSTRKPLIVMSPKSLLRHKLAVSSLDELAHGRFQQLIGDNYIQEHHKVRRVVLCAGKVYYDLWEDRQKRSQDNVVILRVEQLYPFPRPALAAELKRYPAALDVVWCQEEPMNQGAWYQIRHHLQACLNVGQQLHYAGRVRSPSPAAGRMVDHVREQQQLVADALLNPFNAAPVAE